MPSATFLLPSGFGFLAPWLLIAPVSNPVIRIDLRLLHRIEQLPVSDDEDAEDETLILLARGAAETLLHVDDSPEAVKRLVEAAVPYTHQHWRSAEQRSPHDAARLIVLTTDLAGKVFELDKPVCTLARTNENDVRVVHSTISRRHAQITRDGRTGRYEIEDLESSNGVLVNGQPRQRTKLRHGDIVDVGLLRLAFVDPRESQIAALAPSDDHFIAVGDARVVHRGNALSIGDDIVPLSEVYARADLAENVQLTNGARVQAALLCLLTAHESGAPILARVGYSAGLPALPAFPEDSSAGRLGFRGGEEILAISIRCDANGDVQMINVTVCRDGAPFHVVIPNDTKEELLGAPAPTLIMASVDGTTLDIGEHLGRVVVLAFWRAKSKASTRLLWGLASLAEKHTDIRVIGISISPVEQITKVARDNSFPFPLVNDGDGSISRFFGVEPPMVVLIDKSKRVRSMILGELMLAELETQLGPLLKELSALPT